MASVTFRISGEGFASTVWSVVTTGMRTFRSNPRRWSPHSPPKIPYSCSNQHDFAVADVGKVGRESIVGRLLLTNLEANVRRVMVPLGSIVDRDHVTVMLLVAFRFNRLAKVLCEGRDAATTRWIRTDARDSAFDGNFIR